MNEKNWHIAEWHPLAWVETVTKVLALIFGIIALVGALSRGNFSLPQGWRLVQLIVLTVLSLGLVAAISDRITEREIIAMVFVILNNLGHWGMALSLASPPGPGSLFVIFCVLMLLGDLVKLVFLKVTDFTVRDTPRAVMYGLTSFYMVGYAVLLLLEALR